MFRLTNPSFSSPNITRTLGLILFCMAMAWAGSGVFIESMLYRTILSLSAAFFLFFAFRKVTRNRQIHLLREQFRWFLELLLTRLSSGTTLEKAISQTVPGMDRMLGRKSIFLQTLHRIDNQIQAHRPLKTTLPAAASQLRCLEARTFFQLLPELNQAGCAIKPFVHQQFQMISEQLSLEQDLHAEATQRRIEAICLTVMPFAITLLLSSSYDSASVESISLPFSQIAESILYVLSMSAIGITAMLLSTTADQHRYVGSIPYPLRKPKAFKRTLSRFLHRLYRDRLPESYGSRVLQILHDSDQNHADNVSPEMTTLSFFNQKINFLSMGLLIVFVVIITEPRVWFISFLIPIIAYLHDQKLFQQERVRLDAYRLTYPVFLNLLTAFLESGLSPHRSFNIAVTHLFPPNQEKKGGIAVLQGEMTRFLRRVQSGQTLENVLNDMITACPLPEAQAALLILLRYSHSGGTEALHLLSLQASACWSLYRVSMKKRLEQQNIRLLFPMMLDLVVVMIAALLPAVTSLNVF